MRKYLLILVLLPITGWSQEKEKSDPWDAMKYFTGSWEGEMSGMAGDGTGEREYSFILGDKFFHFTNKGVFEPQEKNPDGEVHEDWGFFSYDSGRKQIVLRQFHKEGFINQYVADSISADGKTLVFTTEVIENAPPGMRARLRYEIISDDEFTEMFDLAFAGKDFSVCIENTWKRKK